MRAVKQNIIFFICFIAFFGCNNKQATDSNTVDDSDSVVKIQESSETLDTISKSEEIVITKPKDYTAKYICPSRCPNSGSDKMGDCPTCGMELIENPNSQKVIKKEASKK